MKRSDIADLRNVVKLLESYPAGHSSHAFYVQHLSILSLLLADELEKALAKIEELSPTEVEVCEVCGRQDCPA